MSKGILIQIVDNNLAIGYFRYIKFENGHNYYHFSNSDILNSKWQIITLLLSFVKYLDRAASENFRSACCLFTLKLFSGLFH